MQTGTLKYYSILMVAWLWENELMIKTCMRKYSGAMCHNGFILLSTNSVRKRCLCVFKYNRSSNEGQCRGLASKSGLEGKGRNWPESS